MPNGIQMRISNFCNRFKSFLTKSYTKGNVSIHLLRYLDFIIVRTNGNRFIEFELSNICNARCVFCPYPDMLKTDKKFMHMDESILNKIKLKLNAFKGELVSFTPTTGDTLLHPHWHSAMLGVIEHKGISRATMFTNAIALDEEATSNLLDLIDLDKEGKLSQIYFSVGGLNAENYKSLYQVDRFEKVKTNITRFIQMLNEQNKCTGIHLHFKLKKDEVWDEVLVAKWFNPNNYPFVYYSKSVEYFSNSSFKKNAMIDYYPSENLDQKKPCAYLLKTRFAADGGIWADGCVISEMPGDSSLKLGTVDDEWAEISKNRDKLIDNWTQGNVPLPCQSCTVYRPI